MGTQVAFDRLVHAVDGWAAGHADVDIFAQTGPTQSPPAHIRHAQFMEPSAFQEHMEKAELIIGHAGMGTLINALLLQKPVVIMPRKAELGEHRNDHQLATARWFASRPGVEVVNTAKELVAVLDRRQSLAAPTAISQIASPELIGALRAFIDTGERPCMDSATTAHVRSVS
ncbi:MAG: glycosyltransferase [Phycisphaerales bacterium]